MSTLFSGGNGGATAVSTLLALSSDSLTPEQQQALIEASVRRILRRVGAFTANDPRAPQVAGETLQEVARERSLPLPLSVALPLQNRVVALLTGYGFLDPLLPPHRTDLQEIVLDSQGRVWLRRKAGTHFERHALSVAVEEAWRVVDAILGPQSKALNEAAPSIDARLLPTKDNPGGGRFKFLHPVITGGLYPAFNLRLFELQAPTPAQLIEQWQMTSWEVMELLGQAVTRKLRLMIGGGTATGKTTFLSALGAYIPPTERIVKIEDPAEIYLAQPHVQTLEARLMPPGSKVPDYTVTDGVNDAMRLAPDRLIVGEVRTGHAALALFRAQMSDHPGLSTFHAESPDAALFRLAVIMFADEGVRMEAAKALFAQAVDVYVQLHFDAQGQRRVAGVWQIESELRAGNPEFTPVCQGSRVVGALTRQRAHQHGGHQGGGA